MVGTTVGTQQELSMDSIKISSGWPSEAFTLTIGNAVVVVNDPGQGFGTIPRFGQRRRGKVSRILGRAEAPYFEVVLDGTGEKMLFDDRGSERGARYNASLVERLDEAREAALAAEPAPSVAEPAPSVAHLLVFRSRDLVPVLRELIEKINAPMAAKKE